MEKENIVAILNLLGKEHVSNRSELNYKDYRISDLENQIKKLEEVNEAMRKKIERVQEYVDKMEE